MYSMVTMVNNTLVHTLKEARRVDPERSHHKEKNCKNVWGWILTGLTVAIILQYIKMFYHYIVHLKLI